MALETLYVVLISGAIAIAVLYASRARRRYLRDIPGPFWDSFSYIPRLLKTAYGQRCYIDIDLHRRYGPLVRVGPNELSFSDSSAISQVYSANTRYEKSDFYVPFDAKGPHGWLPTVFSTRSEKEHRGLKKPIFAAYTMAAMLELEPLTDDCIRIFEGKIDEKILEAGGHAIVLNMNDWLHWYAFDVVMSVSFSKPLGFMQQERDVSGMIAAIEGRLRYNATIGQAPLLHRYLLGNSLVSKIANYIPAMARMNTSRRIVQFTAEQINRADVDQGGKGYTDMLERFKNRGKDGEEMSQLDMIIAASGNVFAGSDTTAISLRSLFYYLIKTPRCYGKLLAEIDDLDQGGRLSEVVGFTESQELMPYMQACLKEAMRLHPAVGMPLERIVPEEGITISGKYIPQGTVIGANPWVVARDPEVYGKDVDDFRPERWLEAHQAEKDGDPSRLKAMERNFLAFGTGSRTCLDWTSLQDIPTP
ncbi:hypothetical protein LTR10_011596 [Elasticomyces elasticus]|uniref:Cytochrome P450 n=1 Tax=Exophiala sideris TaxID=1016849 RepID=A0ABR0JCW1_9EURO|nr:hypothetical protein LTR10_011596 [Elasticomyces elasticus]KAK5061791.1 hypothetical protein LTR69_004974 [Exophiala sideris]KAK5184491.1 hypothetical protein LTR44_003165 [Eurotiomycetes sp. CCFEE 6388]